MPGGETQTRLAALVEHLAARLGTEPFTPHVTLLPGPLGPEAETVARAAPLARELAPLTLKLAGIEGRDDPFRCLFVKVEATPALRAAHAAAARAFLREPDPDFFPHLSLVYGRLESDEKASLARDIAEGSAGEIEARRLCVCRTDGEVAEWRGLAVFPLGAA